MPEEKRPEERRPEEKKPEETKPEEKRAEEMKPEEKKPPASNVSLRPIKIVACVAGSVIALFIGAVLVRQHLRSPGYLVARLRGAEGDRREALVMRLNLSRGDVVTPMVAALRDSDAPAEYRADMLELLFKKYNRAADERVEAALGGALADAEPAVRRAAVYGFAVYMRREQQLAVLDLIDDPDAEVRRQVYMLLNSGGRRWGGRRRGRGGGSGGSSPTSRARGSRRSCSRPHVGARRRSRTRSSPSSRARSSAARSNASATRRPRPRSAPRSRARRSSSRARSSSIRRATRRGSAPSVIISRRATANAPSRSPRSTER